MEEIKKTIKEMATLVGADIKEISLEGDVLYVNLKAFGLTEVLGDMQALLRKIIQKKTGQFYHLNLDINGYKKKREEQLKKAVQVIADQASLLKKQKILNPMSSYERRIIHLELSQREDIETESIGEGEERKIIIKPI